MPEEREIEALDISNLTPGPDVLTVAELLPSLSRLFLERTLVSIYSRDETKDKWVCEWVWGKCNTLAPESKSILGRESSKQSLRQAERYWGVVEEIA